MEQNLLSQLGRPIPVPSVQELLAKETLITVPKRYVRQDQDSPFVPLDSDPMLQVPVIDMAKLLSSEKNAVESEVEKLHLASKEWGFFQLINHGVSPSILEGVKCGVQDLFNLPSEEKKKFCQEPGDMEGFGQAFVFNEEQKLDWADLFALSTPPNPRGRLFPKLPQLFRDSVEAFSNELDNISKKILGFMAKALGMDRVNNEISNAFKGGSQGLRLNYYPPCPHPELVMGLNPHSDVCGLTILLQVNEVEGLQIRKDGVWVPIKPLPNAFIVNVGDFLEILTNGIYRSIEHRAVINKEKERLSVAAFYGPKTSGEIGPASSLVTPQNPPLFRRIDASDLYSRYFSGELRGKSHLEFARINTNTEEN